MLIYGFTKCFRLLLQYHPVPEFLYQPSTQFWMLTSYWNVPIVAPVKGLIEALPAFRGWIFCRWHLWIQHLDDPWLRRGGPHLVHSIFSSRPCHSEVPNFSPSCGNYMELHEVSHRLDSSISTRSIPQKDGQIFHHPQRVHIKLFNLWGYPHHKKIRISRRSAIFPCENKNETRGVATPTMTWSACLGISTSESTMLGAGEEAGEIMGGWFLKMVDPRIIQESFKHSFCLKEEHKIWFR